MSFEIYMTAVLVVGSIYDWKYMCIPVWLLGAGVLGGIGNIVYNCLQESGADGYSLLAFLPGVLAIALAFLTRKEIGYGDGILLLGMGGCMGAEHVWQAACLALLAAFFVGVGLVSTRKATLKHKMPFVPFLAFGSFLVVGGELLFG